MTRPIRIQHKDGWYHIANRGIDRAAIYRDTRDRTHFLELLEAAVTRFQMEIHGYVLMDNHYHLILRVPEGKLSQCMQWLNVSYGVWFNRRHNRVGPLFQGRYKSVPVSGGSWLHRLSQYVHLNPVRVRWLGLDQRGRRIESLGLKGAANADEAMERLKVLRGHQWSSYQFYGGYAKSPQWLDCGTILKRAGGRTLKEQTARYRADLEGYVRGGYKEDWAARLRSKLAIGTEEFTHEIKLSLSGGNREAPCKRELRQICSFEEIVRAVERVKGERWASFAERHGDWGRDMVLTLAREFAGMTLKETGALAGGMDYGAVSEAVKRFKIRKKQSDTLEIAFNRALERLNLKPFH